MLKHRVYTACVMLGVFLAVLFVLQPVYWNGFLVIVVLVGLYEWLQLAKINANIPRLIILACCLLLMYCLYKAMIPIEIVLGVSVMLWLLLIATVMLTDANNILFSSFSKIGIAVWLLATTWWLLSELRTQLNGPMWILFFLSIIWSADIGAYFSGKRFGKHKLAPTVSPGKTIEGVVGGLCAVCLLSLLISYKANLMQHSLFLLLLCILTAVISVGGDLYESQLKRQANMKDSGNILPGHGGVLDRIDSVLAGLPFFLAGLMILELIAA